MDLTPPLILLASPGSHAAYLAAMLGRHPRLYAPLELNLLAAPCPLDLLKTLEPDELHGLLRSVAQLYAGEQTIESIEMARRWSFRRANWDSAEVHRELCARVAPKHLVETCILYTRPAQAEALARLGSVYPDAWYLHLVRHPLAVGRDWWRNLQALPELYRLGSRDPSTQPPLPDPQFDWLQRQRLILEFLRTIPPERQLRLRVEDLLAEPRLTCVRLCLWLRLDAREQVIEEMLHPERSPYARPGPYGAEGGAEWAFLLHPQLPPPDPNPVSLTQPLPWRPDGRGFVQELIDLAQSLGYA